MIDAEILGPAVHAIQRNLDAAYLFDDDEFLQRCTELGVTFTSAASNPEWKEDGKPTNAINVEVGDLAELLAAAVIHMVSGVPTTNFIARNIIKENMRISSRGTDIICWNVSSGPDLDPDETIVILEAKASYTEDATALKNKAEKGSQYSGNRLVRIVSLVYGKLEEHDRNKVRANKVKRLFATKRVSLRGFVLTPENHTEISAKNMPTSLDRLEIASADVRALRKAVYGHRRAGRDDV